MTSYKDLYEQCTICPRNCRAERINGKTGYCRATSDMHIARAALHMWEEPCISGGGGSGAVFLQAVILAVCFARIMTYPICSIKERMSLKNGL